MTISGVSTLAVYQSTLADIRRVQTDLFSLQDQISSQFKTRNFQGLDGQVEQFTSFEAKIRKGQTYIEGNTLVLSRSQSTSEALGAMVENVEDIASLIVSRRSANNNIAFKQELLALRAQFTSQLNTNQEGRFLFSGTDTGVQPIREPVPDPLVSGVPDDGYYQGSKEDITVRVQDNFEITYNVRADEPAFQKIFAGIALAIEGDTAKSDDKIKAALDLVQDGLKGVIALQTTVNANIVNLQDVNDRHESFNLYYKGVTETLSKTDLLAASTQVSVDQAVLQATFQAFAKINSLKLSDFLN